MEATFIIPDSRGGSWVGPLLTPYIPHFPNHITAEQNVSFL